MSNLSNQAKHYDKNPSLYPWPKVLSKSKLDITYKPREVFLNEEINNLGLNSKSKLLDIGCGTGIMTKRVSDQFDAKAIGVDISDESIEFANKFYSNDKLSFKLGEANKIPYKNNSFDFIISLDVLEHIENQKDVIFEISRLLKKKGKVLIYTLNKNDRYSLDWIWEKIGIDIYKRAMHKRSLFLDMNKLCNWMNDAGFIVTIKKYYGGFFGLLLDEIIMVNILILKKFGLFKFNKLGKVYLSFLNIISKVFYPLLNSLDYLWYINGYSLGILVVAEKKTN